MTLYKISSKRSYIDSITDFIYEKHASDLSSLIVILPNGYICSYVQKYFIQKYGASVLPNIITINEIGNTCLINRFKPNNIFKMISPLEEKIIISQIIQTYDALKYNIIDSINIAAIFSDLFYEFELNHITHSKLEEKIKALHDSHHWNEIYDFISYVYQKWTQKLSQIKKKSKAKSLMHNLDISINAIKQQKNIKVLIAGFVGDNDVIFNFIKSIYSQSNVDYILPPIGDIDISQIKSTKPYEALYNIVKFCEFLEVTTGNIPLLHNKDVLTHMNLDGILMQNHHSGDSSINIQDQNFKYIEFENIFDEAEFIANKCTKIIDHHDQAQIAIVINDSKCKECYIHLLEKYALPYRDLIGVEIRKSSILSLVYSISMILCHPFNINNFLNIIDHPLMISDQGIELKSILIKRKKFISNIDDIASLIKSHASAECREYFDKLHQMINENIAQPLPLAINVILSKIIDLIYFIKPQIFAKISSTKEVKILEIFDELLALQHNLQLENISDFPDILLHILKDMKIYTQDTGANIILARDQDISLINFDYIFITNLSDGTSPMHEVHHPFLSRMMQEELGLNLSTKNISSAWYNFYLNMQNQNVIMTMPQKQGGKSIAKTSQFILKLEQVIGDKLQKKIGKVIYDDAMILALEEQGACFDSREQIAFEHFPSKISATDIENLIKAPYNFYAKKILKLRPCDDLDESPDLSVFGNIFHKIAEIYTNSHDSLHQDMAQLYNNIVDKVLSDENYPEHNLNIWKTKLLAIRDEFIDFDQARRKECSDIYTEKEGKTTLTISGHDIEIKAIADRIEINRRKNIAYILDYKTGLVPTKINISSGMSPQLIIEALIMMEDGFKLDINVIPKLIYVKIGSSAPYINITEFALSQEELLKHKSGLVSLLEHYIQNKQVQIMPNLLQYDDYAHLARRG